MIRTWWRPVLCVTVILCILGFLLHLAGTPQESPGEEASSQETHPMEPLDLTPAEDSRSRPVFSFSLDDFIACYNSLWEDDLLPPAQLWVKSASLSEAETPAGDCYSASPDPDVWFLPTVSVYTRTDDPAIWKISLDLDEHSDSPEKHGLFHDMSLQALALFFPELSAEKREALYLELDRQAYENLYSGIYHAELVPHILYYQNGVGVFPFFALGEYERFTFLPVTPAQLETWGNQGTQLIDLDHWSF